MNIVGLQWNSVWQNTQANIDELDKSLQTLLEQADTAPDIVLLPEVFLSGFSMRPVEFAESIDGDSMQQLKALASKYRLALIFGMATKQVSNTGYEHFNSALMIDKHGELIEHYRKQKLFAYANEHHAYQAGKPSQPFVWQGARCAMFICYDLRFPEIFRNLAKQVDIVFIVASWPESRQLHWETLLKARAIENQCFIIGVNRTGIDGNGLHYAGGSMVIDPLGEILAYGRKQDEMIQAEIDIAQVCEVRKQFPFLDDM
ncbi:nitrilase-related carbon-nitrogen hydrolase [Thiomicrorhabdus sediminis]|uniref:Carbon-nitrogen family hydrolase n=1 Tax=Thiomicrorhabdus sediminis TaxID=2580412 RepID=A0A4P9K475_9GAMM|nr:nitrilase-related carbon-nitrogen hydrolase [Thiomicrorhabdus sediminis]QCU89715.1 carbon-nitrogen family hydrolase [Thiomicrorhabdus sediminis]